MAAAPIDFVWMDLAPEGFVHRGYRMADLGFSPQHSIDYQIGLQEQHRVAGNYDKDSPTVVDNFDTG